MTLGEEQTALCEQNEIEFSDLRAVLFNSLKHPDQASHTSLLMGTSGEIMRKSGVAVEEIRMTAHNDPESTRPAGAVKSRQAAAGGRRHESRW